MFGPRLGTVFASRWKALWWSAAVLLTAYCTVPSRDDTATGDADQAQQLKEAQQAVEALEQLNDAPSQD